MRASANDGVPLTLAQCAEGLINRVEHSVSKAVQARAAGPLISDDECISR